MSDVTNFAADGDEIRCITAGSWLATEVACCLGWEGAQPYQAWSKALCWGVTAVTFEFPKHRLEISLLNRKLLSRNDDEGSRTVQVAKLTLSESLTGRNPQTIDVAADERFSILVKLSARLNLVWSGEIAGVVKIFRYDNKEHSGAEPRYGCGCYSLEHADEKSRADDQEVRSLPFSDFATFVKAQCDAQTIIQVLKLQRQIEVLTKDLPE